MRYLSVSMPDYPANIMRYLSVSMPDYSANIKRYLSVSVPAPIVKASLTEKWTRDL